MAGDLTHYLTKLNQATLREAEKRHQQGERFSRRRLLLTPMVTFLKTFLCQKNIFKTSGMITSLLKAYEVFLTEGKLWELEAKPWLVYERLKNNDQG